MRVVLYVDNSRHSSLKKREREGKSKGGKKQTLAKTCNAGIRTGSTWRGLHLELFRLTNRLTSAFMTSISLHHTATERARERERGRGAEVREKSPTFLLDLSDTFLSSKQVEKGKHYLCNFEKL